MTWLEAVALVREYAEVLQGWLEDRYVTGRIKQWMNFLRQGFPEAEAIWSQARKIREVAPMLACLEQGPKNNGVSTRAACGRGHRGRPPSWTPPPTGGSTSSRSRSTSRCGS